MIQILLVILAALFLFPFVWMLCTSLKTEAGIADYKQFFPWPVSFRAFEKGWKGGKFLIYIWNTVKIAGLCVIGTVCSCSLVGFGFAKFQSKAKNILFLVLLATMMVPQTVTLIPMYIMYSKFHWLNTIYPLVLPAFFGTSTFNIFLLRQFFAGLPNDLAEAAKIDGAGLLQQVSRIKLPVIKPVLLTALSVRIIDAARTFDIIWAMTEGGPNSSSETISIIIYKTLTRYNDIGYASAMAIVFIAVLVIFTLVFMQSLWNPKKKNS